MVQSLDILLARAALGNKIHAIFNLLNGMLGQQRCLLVLSLINVVQSNVITDQSVEIDFLELVNQVLGWSHILGFSLYGIESPL